MSMMSGSKAQNFHTTALRMLTKTPDYSLEELYNEFQVETLILVFFSESLNHSSARRENLFPSTVQEMFPIMLPLPRLLLSLWIFS